MFFTAPDGKCWVLTRMEPDGKTVREVLAFVNAELKRIGLDDDGTWGTMDGAEFPWPESYRWIAVFPVTGSSEGHYMHLDLYLDGYSGGQASEPLTAGRVLHLALSKTFSGMVHAEAVCDATRRILGS